MPYYIYKVFPFFRLEKVAEFASFKEASAHAKALRPLVAAQEQCAVKVMFAENEARAEELLTRPREPEPLTGDDY